MADEIPVAEIRHRIDVLHSIEEEEFSRYKAFDFDPERCLLACAIIKGNGDEYTGSLSIWHLMDETLERLCDYQLPAYSRAVRFMPNCSEIVAGCDDNNLHLLRLVFDSTTKKTSLEEIRIIRGHSDYVRAIVVHPTKPNIVLSAADDTKVFVWDTSSDWKVVAKIPAHNHYAMSIAINPENDDEFATASLDLTARLFKLSSVPTSWWDSPEKIFDTDHGPINSVIFLKDVPGLSLAVGTDARPVPSVDFFNFSSGFTRKSLCLHSYNVTCLAQVGSLLFSGSETGTKNLSVVDLKSWTQERLLTIPQGKVWAFGQSKVTETASLLFVGADKGMVVLKVHDDVEQPDTAPLQFEVLPRERKAWRFGGMFVPKEKDNLSCPTFPNPFLSCLSWLPFSSMAGGSQRANPNSLPATLKAPEVSTSGHEPSLP